MIAYFLEQGSHCGVINHTRDEQTDRCRNFSQNTNYKMVLKRGG